MPVHEFNFKPRPIFRVGKKETERILSRYGPEKGGILITGNPVMQAPAIPAVFIDGGPYRVGIKALSFYGIEIEMEQLKFPDVHRDTVADKFETRFHDLGFYAKHDGSIHNGFEIVSHPRTYSSWVEISARVKDLLRDLKEAGMRSRDTGRCAIHFHTNISSFNDPLHITKWGMFFQKNADFFYTASHRNAASTNQYAWFARNPVQWATTIFRQAAGHWGRRINTGRNRYDWFAPNLRIDHHAGVNLTRSTIEVRFFRGTMDFTSILRLIRFQERLKEFVAVHSISQLTIPIFFEWLKDVHDDTRLVNYFQKSVLKPQKAPYRSDPDEWGERWKPVSKEQIIKSVGEHNERAILNIKKKPAAAWSFEEWLNLAMDEWNSFSDQRKQVLRQRVEVGALRRAWVQDRENVDGMWYRHGLYYPGETTYEADNLVYSYRISHRVLQTPEAKFRGTNNADSLTDGMPSMLVTDLPFPISGWVIYIGPSPEINLNPARRTAARIQRAANQMQEQMREVDTMRIHTFLQDETPAMWTRVDFGTPTTTTPIRPRRPRINERTNG